jgi:hypothetical protein
MHYVELLDFNFRHLDKVHAVVAALLECVSVVELVQHSLSMVNLCKVDHVVGCLLLTRLPLK